LFPTGYTRSGSCPRLVPFGRGSSRLGFLGVHKAFRNAALGDLNKRFLSLSGYGLFELELQSCHLKILADFNLDTPKLHEVLATGQSVWQYMVNSLSTKIQEGFSPDFLKSCFKKVASKCLQGERIDSVKKIHKMLSEEEELSGKDLLELAEACYENPLLQECNALNVALRDQMGQAGVFAPMDSEPLVYNPTRQTKNEWVTKNICHLTAHVVTGAEIFQILVVLEGMKRLQLPWLPVSLHYDGFTFLGKEGEVEENRKCLEAYVDSRLETSGCKPLGLEIRQYKKELEGSLVE